MEMRQMEMRQMEMRQMEMRQMEMRQMEMRQMGTCFTSFGLKASHCLLGSNKLPHEKQLSAGNNVIK
jgi:hypothetical protein